MLAYWDPFTDFARVQSRLLGVRAPERDFRPAVDIVEDEAGIQLRADLAGVKAEDIKVNVENNVLTISGERKFERDEKRDEYHRVERFHGRFSRAFSLPDEVDGEQVDAKYDAGVLTVSLVKRASAKRREIAVKAA